MVTSVAFSSTPNPFIASTRPVRRKNSASVHVDAPQRAPTRKHALPAVLGSPSLVSAVNLRRGLAVTEGLHALAHVGVLLHLSSIADVGHVGRCLYFGFDLLSNVASWYATPGYNHALNFAHLGIHAFALAHLLGFETSFFRDVFRMGELDFDGIPLASSAGYYAGTIEDIVTHALNAARLLRGKPQPASAPQA